MRRVESAPSLMKKDPDHNSTDSAEIEALITRIERGQLRDEDGELSASGLDFYHKPVNTRSPKAHDCFAPALSS